jgi:hypothetical protein
MRTSSWRLNRRFLAVAAVFCSWGGLGGAPRCVRAQTLSQGLIFTAIQPCRLVDTRVAGGALVPGTPRLFNAVGVGSAGSLSGQGGNPGGCPIPGFSDIPQVQAVLLNVVAVTPAGAGDLRAWPSDQAAPTASIINYGAGLTLANAVVIPVRQDHQGGDITVQADVSASQLVADVLGYFADSSPTSVNGTDALFLGAKSGNPPLGTGAEVTAIGVFSLRNNTSGDFNTGLGTSTLSTNTTGGSNTALGALALFSNTTGTANTAVGVSSLSTNATGQGNTGVGVNSLLMDASGTGNTAVGAGALNGSSSGSNNVAIGEDAGGDIFDGESNNIFIANTATMGDNGVIRIGTPGTQFSTFIAGISGATSASGIEVLVNTSGQLGTTTSSLRFKQDVADMDAADVLMRLRPVTFHYRPEVDDGSHLLQYGLVQFGRDGRPEGVRYHFVNAMLLDEVQRQHRRIAEQDAHLRGQDAELAALRGQLEEQRRRAEELERSVAELRQRLDRAP